MSTRTVCSISGGAGRDRTGDLLNANQALSQLSYSPVWKTYKNDRGRLDAGTFVPPCFPAFRQGRSMRTSNLWKKSPGRVRGCFHAARSFELAHFHCSRLDRNGCPPYIEGNSGHVLFRKEVIQPQVLLRLPCYDFTPIMSHTLGRCPLAVGARTSSTTHFRDVTGGVYKARERIHGGVLIHHY